jgi:hypothetical protein
MAKMCVVYANALLYIVGEYWKTRPKSRIAPYPPWNATIEGRFPTLSRSPRNGTGRQGRPPAAREVPEPGIKDIMRYLNGNASSRPGAAAHEGI